MKVFVKLFLPLLCVGLALGCASTSSSRLPGQTLTNSSPRLRKDALRTVATYEMALAPYKGPLRVVDTRVIQPPDRVGVELGTERAHCKWVERWVVQRGATNFAYRLMFDARGSQGADIAVAPYSADLLKGPVDVIHLPESRQNKK